MGRNCVAICISGQVRSNNEQLAEISESAKEIGADVFISVWRKRGGKSFESGHKHLNLFRTLGPSIAMFFPKNWCQNFKSLFPDWSNLLPTGDTITKKELTKIFPKSTVDIEDDILDLDLPSELNSLRMLYKIWRCNSLKRKHENANGFKYDRVIRLRPDILLNFKTLVDSPKESDELLVKTRRANGIHDTYWASSSEVDDKMAGMFGHTLANRMGTWRGIHHELSDYIKKNKIIPVNTRCIKTDFSDFGGYSDQAREEMVRKFNYQLTEMKNDLNKRSDELIAEMIIDVLGNACLESIGETWRNPKTGMVEKLDALLENEPLNSESWHVISPVSLAYARNIEINGNLRGLFAFSVLMEDALHWPTFLGLRIANIGQLLPNHGSEILQFIGRYDATMNFYEDAAERHPLAALLFKRLRMTEVKKVRAAYDQVSKAVLNNNDLRSQMYRYLSNSNRFDDLLTLAKLYKGAFPDRKNARNLVASTEREIKRSTQK